MVRVDLADETRQLANAGHFFAIDPQDDIAGLQTRGRGRRIFGHLRDSDTPNTREAVFREIVLGDLRHLDAKIAPAALDHKGKSLRCFVSFLLRFLGLADRENKSRRHDQNGREKSIEHKNASEICLYKFSRRPLKRRSYNVWLQR